MKYISFILTSLCLCCQTELQAVTSTTTSTLQTSITNTIDKHISKDEGSGIIKPQTTKFGQNQFITKYDAQKKNDPYALKKEGGILRAQSGAILGQESGNDDMDAYWADIRKRDKAKRAKQEEQAKQAQAKAEAAKQQQRVTILTYGSIGIVLSFIIITIVTFSILYVRRNRDNPKCHEL